MLQWLAHGHISPFLELVKKLSDGNFHIYFCSTPINLKPLRDTLLAPDRVSSIQLIDLHLPSDDFPQLPPHYHTTKDLPPHLMSTLKSAFDSAKSSFFDILRSLKPNLVIFDYLQPWASVAAKELNINAVNKERFWECMERSSTIVLIKTSRVTEGKYVDYLSELVKRKVVTVGPLLQEPANKDGNGEKIMEFIGGEDVPIHEALPQGFLQRIGDRGLVVEGWAPQAKILGHPNIGGLVSHCGWSSTLEAILFGVPIIAMPMHLDQPLNAKLVVEIGVGMAVDRGNGGFRREEVARVIQEVMVEEKGKEAKRNAQELGKRMREKQKGEMDDVVNKLKQLVGV
ncbi:hypothetical protein BT93_B1843 [Corymbia citriodora subsp. variegata]|nr:hypothetical protein BT93_B1843 [Corymbia citriodora subsp. variegata]